MGPIPDYTPSATVVVRRAASLYRGLADVQKRKRPGLHLEDVILAFLYSEFFYKSTTECDAARLYETTHYRSRKICWSPSHFD